MSACATGNGGCDPLQPCSDSAERPGESDCGPCPRGYKTTPKGCADVDGCAASRPQRGSLTPCAPRVSCADVRASPDMPDPSAFTCGACPPGWTGDGLRCSPCPLAVAITGTSFSGASAPASRPVQLFASASAPAGGACPDARALGGVALRWRGDQGGFLVPLSGAENGAFGATLTLQAGLLIPGQLARFVVEARFFASLSPPRAFPCAGPWRPVQMKRSGFPRLQRATSSQAGA